jgi:hypothetical protein
MPDLAYYTSERFIHDGLVKEARSGLKSLYATWASQSKIDPFVLVWPEKAIDYHGHKTAGMVPFDLPVDKKKRPAELQRLLRAADAYAMLVVEQREAAVVVIFESPHGTQSWHIPIEGHGNVDILGDPTEKTDSDYLGLLWVPTRSRGSS